ncbi:MAG: hypothetical protein ABL963_01725 [Longimicrobiales bacterium]
MVRLVGAWVLVNGLLLAPSWIVAGVFDTPFAWLSVEATVLVGAMALLPARPWARVLAWVVGGAVVLLAMALVANLVFEQSLGRALDLSLDLYLLDAVYRLAVGNLGRTITWLAIVGAVGVGTACVAGLGWLLSPLRGDSVEEGWFTPARVGSGFVVVGIVLGVAGFGLPSVVARAPAPALAFVYRQSLEFGARREERATFFADLQNEPALPAPPALLGRLEGRAVVLAYVESYGMAALDDPQFASVVRPLLDSAQGRLDAAGIHQVTGSFVSPTLGGQSWYAHGTMLSGLWLENQLRYELLLTSERETLVDDFRRAGYRTATVMPAITTPWPEAVRIGYDEVHTAQSMPYAGPPLYWVTMPDQFTWSFMGALLRDATGPVFIEAGMVSSHAPWTPIVPLVEWDDVGDGSVFEAQRMEGDPPEEAWWDVDILRSGYAHSLAYSLESMLQFTERYLDERTLLIVAGDHQAAPWVTGSSSPNVPVHVMARDAALLEPFEELGFVRGAFPDASQAVHRMDEFRTWFVGAYSGSEAPQR